MTRPVGVKRLVEAAGDGGFSLPDRLTEAYQRYLAIEALDIGALNTLDAESAAEQLRALLSRGETVDLLALGRGVEAGDSDRRSHSHGLSIRSLALDQQAEEASMVAVDLHTEIIVQHLRPTFEQVMQEAAEVAPALAGYELSDARSLMREDKETKAARAALRALEPLAVRRRLLVYARNQANLLAHKKPELDVSDVFALMRAPQHLMPGWKPGERMDFSEIPKEPVQQMLWWSTTARPAQPWLPLPSEQDNAWSAVFGELAEKRKAAAVQGEWMRIIGN